MIATDFTKVIAFEDGLSVGNEVRIRWTNSNTFWSGRGILKKINRQSFIVTLSEEVGGPDCYSAGRDIKAPRLSMGSGMKLWSCNNRLEPVGGYE